MKQVHTGHATALMDSTVTCAKTTSICVRCSRARTVVPAQIFRQTSVVTASARVTPAIQGRSARMQLRASRHLRHRHRRHHRHLPRHSAQSSRSRTPPGPVSRCHKAGSACTIVTMDTKKGVRPYVVQMASFKVAPAPVERTRTWKRCPSAQCRSP